MEVKGIAIKNLKRWVLKNYNEDKWQNFLDKLPKKLETYFKEDGIFSSEWYPYELFKAINQIIIDEIGNGDVRVMFKVGKEDAHLSLNGVHRIFMKIVKPSYVAKKAALIYNQYYNFGKLEINSLEEGEYKFSLNAIENIPFLFNRVAGFMEGTLVETRAKNARVTFEYNSSNRKAEFVAKFNL